ncbi:hypothetical protein GAN98_06410 [Bacteroides thetaiotaomicron]|uniref:NVEALA protein n=1 Tax=Bacteroides thetaiotaomicron TaxID=818 RepID=A0A6I0SEB2_BACT4|nr:NVEALA domain-containing protein [Bacteroides sp. AR20]KAB4464792.1 hypothetical protein GAN98_06410 [Bacteroides thetaiotaomicron]KAB4465339.1 hypothetical protein GAN67_09570 [Bacteroides thetaiotaomicron]KAB4474975.1 hypothetical protein GAN76_08270 [Bacteroides thetaiotaomicron]KAB4478005.1 hypothetical protein GAN59_03590 [Bacteroides thetaiotaomicron]KAB4487462.1 hypothetical protein GAN57_06430 [Bacteroides thetaiotaomicron]
MKKKLISMMAIVAVAIIAGYNVYTSQNNVKLSSLALSNVEALAENEWVTYYCRMSPWTWECKNTVYGTVCYCNM